MAKILVADDEADLETLIKQKFRQKIRSKNTNLFFAVNEKDALEKLIQHPDVDIVLSDIICGNPWAYLAQPYGGIDNFCYIKGGHCFG